MCWALLVKPGGLPHQDPYTQWFCLLIVGLLFTDSEFSCLAMLAKPCPVSGPTYMPQIPNRLHCMSKCAHEELETISEATLMSVFHTKIICFVLLWLDLCT